MGLLQASLSPILDNFKFQFDSSLVEFMTPGPDTVLTVLKNEPINLFVFLNEKFDKENSTLITMSYFDSQKNKICETFLEIKKDDAMQVEDSIQKLGAHEIVREYEASLLEKINPDIYRVKKTNIKKQMLNLSLQY